MRLIYINEIGLDYKHQRQYEFIFSDEDEIDMDEWFTIPAASTSVSKSPDVEYIKLVGLLKDTELELDLIQNSDYFGVIDAVQGIISLGWEKFDNEAENPRISFKFGEKIESVDRKLEQRNYKLIKTEI
jgi:hypothetical protein